jgi:hypothetical protein
MNPLADAWPTADLCHIADSIKFGGGYRGQERPFVGGVSEINRVSYCGVSPEEISAISTATGMAFSHSVELGAMCNDTVDHQLLCEIARFIAATYNGYVDFNEVITDNPPDDLLTVTWLEEGRESKTQIGRAAACDWWLAQERFRMTK